MFHLGMENVEGMGGYFCLCLLSVAAQANRREVSHPLSDLQLLQ